MSENETVPPLDVAAIDALCDAATAGPWERFTGRVRRNAGRALDQTLDVHNAAGVVVVGWSGFDSADGNYLQRGRDARFIAAARTLVPQLVERVRALEADAERYQWLKANAPGSVCAMAWQVGAATAFGEPDACVDAARTATPRTESADESLTLLRADTERMQWIIDNAVAIYPNLSLDNVDDEFAWNIDPANLPGSYGDDLRLLIDACRHVTPPTESES